MPRRHVGDSEQPRVRARAGAHGDGLDGVMDAAAPAGLDHDADGPWALPDNWRWIALGELGTWTGGGTPSKANTGFWSNGTVPWVSPKDMKVEVIGETEDKITTDAVEGSSAKYVAEG